MTPHKITVVKAGETAARIVVRQFSGRAAPVIASSIYKRPVHTLFELLAGKSIDMPQEGIDRKLHRRQPTIDPSILAKGLMILGILSVTTGVLTVLLVIRLLSNAHVTSLVKPMLMEGTSDMILGTLTIASSRVIAKGRLLGIWLYIGSILINYLYSLAVGEKLNYIVLGFSILFIWQILKSRSELRLSWERSS